MASKVHGIKDPELREGACLWDSWHRVCPPDKVDADTVLFLGCLVLESELCVRRDDSNLAQVFQNLGAVVLPVAENSHCQLGSLELTCVAFFAHQMDVRLISATACPFVLGFSTATYLLHTQWSCSKQAEGVGVDIAKPF